MIYYINKNEMLQEAINKLNSGDTLYLQDQIYDEKIVITTNNITIIGKGNSTVITNFDYSPKIHSDNKEYNTFRTYTVLVLADNVTIKNLKIENRSKPSSLYGQAVALHVLGDLFTIDDCSISGAQDTIFCGPLPPNLQIKYIGFLNPVELLPKKSRQLYNNCYIEGDVDFIFGGGIAIFNKCTIHCLETKMFTYIAAPSHNKDDEFGFTFIDCLIECNLKHHETFLARPWRDYGKATFINPQFKNADALNPAIWNKWNNSDRDKTARFEIYGSNFDLSKAEPWGKILSKSDLAKYTVENIFNK